MAILSAILSFVGTIAATLGSTGCIFAYVDEPTCPKSLIEK